MAEVLSTHTPELFADAIKKAAARLRTGELVALPTETVYGLAANALNAAAVAKIYEAKNRPPHNPIIVHVSGLEMARACVAEWPEVADRLATSFWPGPLTLVLRRALNVPDVVTAGGETVGVRWPAHPFMQAVIRECGFPLAAPSANLSNRVSPTNAEHVRTQLGQRISLIVDGGQAQVGIESTVLDLTCEPPMVLRPGMINNESLVAVTGDLLSHERMRLPGGDLRSPGMLEKHYAPKANLQIWGWRDEADLKAQLAELGPSADRCHIIAHTRVPVSLPAGQISVIPHDAEAFARAIYAELHRCDAAGAAVIIVETLPSGPGWRAISDRLERAAAKTPLD